MYLFLNSLLSRRTCGFQNLTLSGTGQGTFTCMSLLDQILSADFFFKNLVEVKIDINRVILTTCPAH